MEAVEVRKALDGGVWVTARAESIGEALAAVKALHELPPSEAYRVARDAYARSGAPLAPELTPEQEARLAATEPPEPIDVLNVDKPLAIRGDDSYGEGL